MNLSLLDQKNGQSFLVDQDPQGKCTSQNRLGRLNWAIFNVQKVTTDVLLEECSSVDYSSVKCYYRSPLHSSVYSGDLDVAKKLLDKGASPNVKDKDFETPLHLAARFQKYAFVDLLLCHKNLENCLGRQNFSHLHIACMRNCVDAIRRFKCNLSDINAAVKSESAHWGGYTPLHIAVYFQCVETVEYLLNNGADITIRATDKQLTALHLAHMNRHNQIIDMILGAHEKVFENPVSAEGLSHFHIACTRNNPNIVRSFIEKGVSLGSTDSPRQSWSDYTAIDYAIYYDCIDVVRLLLLEGGRKIFPSTEARIKSAHLTGNMKLVDLLLSRDRLQKETTLEIRKLPTLHHSCIYEDIEAVKKSLAEAPSEINTPIWQGDTPLHLAVKRGDIAIVDYLLREGADFNVKNANGQTPLHIAFERDPSSNIVESIADKLYPRIEENPVDNNGLSHFHIACSRYDRGTVEGFIKLGVDVNSSVNFDSPYWPGFTPLHFATKFQYSMDEYDTTEVVSVLLKHNASYSALDKFGLSPFDVAIDQVYDFAHDDEPCRILLALLMHHLKHKVESFNDRGFSVLHLLLYIAGHETSVSKGFIHEHREDINKPIHKLNTRWDGYTPLHFAMMSGHLYHAKYLIEMGADLSIKAASGDTPLHLTPLTMLCFRMPKILMRRRDFDSVKDNPIGTTGYSIFHIICSAGNIDLIKYFLKHGVDPNVRTKFEGLDIHDKTPLHWVTRSYAAPKLEVVKLLLESGANPKLRDFCLNTPLHHICAVLEPEIIDILISHGVDVNARNNSLETPLLSLIRNCYEVKDYQMEAMLLKFLDLGADINLADEKGDTPVTAVFWNTWSSEFRSSAQVVLKHLMKFKVMGLYISENNQVGYEKLAERNARRWDGISQDFEQQCRNERDLLMKTCIDTQTTLHDVFFKDSNDLAVLTKNDKVQKMIQVNGIQDLRRRFPIYGSMLELKLKNGQERRPLLEKSPKTLEFLMNFCVPREISEKIVQFLPNEDLKNVIESVDEKELNRSSRRPSNHQVRMLRSRTVTVTP